MRCMRPFLLLLVLTLIAEEGFAIPAFARKYDTSCLTCHAPFPRLKAYGEDFAAAGFQLPDKDAPRFTRETADPELLLMRELPLALRLQGFLSWEPQGLGRSEVQSPHLLKLLSGGQIAKDVSYYFYFFFSEMGSVAGLEDAFVMFNNVFNSELDVTVGQFQVSDTVVQARAANDAGRLSDLSHPRRRLSYQPHLRSRDHAWLGISYGDGCRARGGQRRRHWPRGWGAGVR